MKHLCYSMVTITIGLFLYGSTYGQVVKDSMKIYFRQGSSILDSSLLSNKEVLVRLTDSLRMSFNAPLYRIKEITIAGGASPEGSIGVNKKLSEKRARGLFDYISRYVALPSESANMIQLGRDWKGLLEYVKNDPHVPYQAEVVKLLEDIGDGRCNAVDDLEELMKFRDGEPYRYMYQKFFPYLRASVITFSYEKIMHPIALPPVIRVDRVLPPDIESRHLTITVRKEGEQIRKPLYMSIKSNLLSDLLLLPTIGVEFYLGNHYSIASNWTYAWWKSDRRRKYWRMYGGDISFRKWFPDAKRGKPLTGHHIGVYAQVLTYDFLWNGKGYIAGEPNGDIFDHANYAVGIDYGYAWPIASRLNLDFSIGVGYMKGKYYEYLPIDNCYVWQAIKRRNYIGPTKAEVSLVWLIGGENYNTKKGGRR